MLSDQVANQTKCPTSILAPVRNPSAAYAYAFNKNGCSGEEAAMVGSLRDPDERFARPLGYTTYIIGLQIWI